VTFPCKYVLLCELFHFYFSSFYLNPLLMRISIDLKILYSFLHKKHINHFTFLTSFFYPPSLVCDFPLAWRVSWYCCIYWYWVYSPHRRDSVQLLDFWTWLVSLKMTFQGSSLLSRCSYFLSHSASPCFFILKLMWWWIHSSVIYYKLLQYTF
jgi:hypothetical protein